MKHSRQSIFMGATAICFAGMTLGAQAQIGMVASAGSFTIAGVKSAGTATVFNGDALATGTTASRVHLSNGVDLTMAPHSTGAIFADHISLTSGTVSAQVDGGFRVQTAGLIMQPREAGTQAQVQIADNRVTVAIPAGRADIATSQGTLVAHMMPGNSMNYQNVNDDKSVQAVGVLDRQDGHYLIRDRFTNVVSELSGNIPPSYVDKLVRVTGSLSTENSSVPQVDRLVAVQQIKRTDATSAVPCESDPGGSVAKEMTVDGVLGQDHGHYLVSTSDHGVVEVMGNVDQASLGKTVHMKGAIVTGQTAFAPAEQIVYTEKRKFVYSDSPCAGLITGGMLITAGMLIHPGDGSSVAQSRQPVSF
jgi:hypothetical protein